MVPPKSSGGAAGIVSDRASSTQNVLPRPGSLVTPSEPPMASASARDSARPRPVPSTDVCSAPSRSNGRNIIAICDSDRPMPVSVTMIRNRRRDAGLSAVYDVEGRGCFLVLMDRTDRGGEG